MNASLPVRIASLGSGLHTIRLTPEAASLDLDPSEFRDLVVDVTLDVGTGQLVATVDASATAHLVCDRTAQPFDQPVSGTYTVLFTQNAALANEEDEVYHYGPYDATIDLGSVVHDTLVLALPQRRLAPGADDLDVPMSFGADDAPDEAPVDDRWEALRRLRDEGRLS